MAGDDITGLHHVGHVVRDMGQALELYRRLGFAVAPPAYPVLPREAGGPVEPFGVANAHVHFPDGFVELVAVVDGAGHMPAEARPIALEVPDDRLPALRAAISATAATITASLRRFQGLHIMVADTPDIDAVAARLTAAGVVHGGVHTVQRPVETSTGTVMEPARYLEISDPDLPPGRVPEGRVGVAENAAVERPDGELRASHPNGATGLAECVLCVDDPALPEVERRYEVYFGPAGGGRAKRFERAKTTVVAASELAGLLPGDLPGSLPAFAAYAVSVRDIGVAEEVLRANGVPAVRAESGEVVVPSHAALGVAVVFREDG